MDGKTPNIVEENIEKLKELFPEIVVEGKVDFLRLKNALGDYTEIGEENFRFNWYGKTNAYKQFQTQSTGTLRPQKDKSKDWDTTQNLYIEGDNLEVLKLLKNSYSGKIKMIYIDPPYNTEKDFVYHDDFTDSILNYKRITGQVDENDLATTANIETEGGKHSNWLSMMYPRLLLARQLLSEDGIIFIHIDEHEDYNLKKLCNDVFGINNDLGCIIWDKRNPKGSVAGVAFQHESILVYSKNKGVFSSVRFTKQKENAQNMLNKVKNLIKKYGGITDEVRSEYKMWINEHKSELSGGESAYSKIDDFGRIYQPVSMAAPDKPETRSHKPLIHPITGRECPVPEKGWRFTDEKMKEILLADKVEFGPDENTQPRQKYFLSENMEESVSSLLYYGGSGDFDGISFDNPKPMYVVKKLIGSVYDTTDFTVLDFFSGSATTAHAVMMLNAEDGGNRIFIMVQLPELCGEDTEAYKAGYKNICEIGEERIRRAGDKIKAELQEEYDKHTTRQQSLIEEDNMAPMHPDDLDVGFKVFSVDNSNLERWNLALDDGFEDLSKEEKNSYISEKLGLLANNFVDGRTELDMVYEIMLKYGLDLSYPVEKSEVSGKNIYNIGFGSLIVCMDDEVNEDVAEGIINVVNEYKPETVRVVIKDLSFNTNANKTNFKETLRTGVETYFKNSEDKAKNTNQFEFITI